MKVLTDLFNLFYRSIFRIGNGSPVTNFYWQCGTLKVEYMILQRKLNFIHHLANLPVQSLAGEIFQIQEVQAIGIMKECEEHLAKLNFPVNRHASKWHWKREVRKYIFHVNKQCLLEEMKRYKKLDYDTCSRESFERKYYFFDLNLEQVRDKF